MENQAKNTVTTFKTQAGVELKMTLNFFLLYQLKAKHPDVYKRYNDAVMYGLKDLFDAANVLYAAYLCAHMGDSIEYSFEAFLELLGDDTQGVMKKTVELIGSKKKANSETPS